MKMYGSNFHYFSFLVSYFAIWQKRIYLECNFACKEYGFIFPSSKIYDGLSAVYDYAQNGRIKRTYRILVEINGSNER
jgi:hypothetical protein